MSLIETLIAVVVLGFAVSVLVGAMGTGIIASDAHRKAATADTVVRSYAEALKLKVAGLTGTGWCSTSSYSLSGLYSPPSGFTVTPVNGTCPGATSPQFQSITLTASSTASAGAHQDSETLMIIVRPQCPRASC